MKLPFEWMRSYAHAFCGFGITSLVQSSSMFSSIIFPFCKSGLVRLDESYSLVVGSCIGTTITGFIAAYANVTGDFNSVIQISLTPFFNRVGNFVQNLALEIILSNDELHIILFGNLKNWRTFEFFQLYIECYKHILKGPWIFFFYWYKFRAGYIKLKTLIV